MSTDTRAALVEREAQIFNRYGEVFPDYAWTDARTAVDLMAAEILTLRGELSAARSAPEERGEGAREEEELFRLYRILGMGGFAGNAPEEMFLAGDTYRGCDAWLDPIRCGVDQENPLGYSEPVRYIRADLSSPPAPIEGQMRYKLSAQNGADHNLSAPVEGPTLEDAWNGGFACAEGSGYGNFEEWKEAAAEGKEYPKRGTPVRAAAPVEGERERIENVLRTHRLSYYLDEDGDNLGLVDALSSGEDISTGLAEIRILADEIDAALASLPVQGDNVRPLALDAVDRLLSEGWRGPNESDSDNFSEGADVVEEAILRASHPVRGEERASIIRTQRPDALALFAVLDDAGIDAELRRAGERWKVWFPRADLARAADLAPQGRAHPVQGAGGGEPSRDHIDALLGRLDEIARDCDRFEFGLPLYNDDAREAMIVAVREWAASPAPSAPEEEPSNG